MKKVLLVILALFVLSANQVQASDLNKLSDDSKIISALNVLEDIGSNDVITRLKKSSTTIVFYDLALMDFSYAKHFAVASTDDYGNNYVLINEKFRNSPKEAIACLIAHESVHQLPQATLEEETAATLKEAQTWAILKNKVAATTNNALITRLNNLTPSETLIREAIANNSFYRQQLAMK